MITTTLLRPQQRPSAKGQLPRAMMITYTDYDQDNGLPTDEHLKDVYFRILQKNYARLGYIPGGKPSHCYRNALRTVIERGGSIVCGWLVITWNARTSMLLTGARHRVATGNNSLSHIEAIGHAVWRSPEGTLYEVTDGYDGCQFMVDNNVRFGCQVGLNFLDAAEHLSPAPFHLFDNMYRRDAKLW